MTGTAGDTSWLDDFGLNDRERRFVLEYLADETNHATAAAERAGFKKGPGLHVTATRVLRRAKVAAAIEKGRAEIERAIMLDAEAIHKLWADVATADPNELIQHRIGASRFCHGVEHQFQWKTPREFEEAHITVCFDLWPGKGEDATTQRALALARDITDPRLPSDAGGYGYRITADPGPECPECAADDFETFGNFGYPASSGCSSRAKLS